MPRMSSRAGMVRGAKVYVAGHRGLLGSALVCVFGPRVSRTS